ncbi:MAG: hypothetical protein LBJ00_09125 [Planctomycetaceae bacterium]|nr:hypothetical protein [Planctomycetaceae bacterium]
MVIDNGQPTFIESYSEDYIVVGKNTTATFKLLGEFNGKPPVSEEVMPHTPEWKFDSSVTCVPYSDKVIRPFPTPQNWTQGETISTTVTAKSSAVGLFRLTYYVQIRFPKVKRDGTTPIMDAQGNPTYFAPYSASVTVTLKVTDAKFKVWIESVDDNFPGHSLFKLGIMETGEIKIGKVSSTDPALTFSRSELGDDSGQVPFILGSQYILASANSGVALVKVWAKNSSGKEYGPESLRISVMKPSGVGMVRHKDNKNVRHLQGRAGAGYQRIVLSLAKRCFV